VLRIYDRVEHELFHGIGRRVCADGQRDLADLRPRLPGLTSGLLGYSTRRRGALRGLGNGDLQILQRC
jgi:hypothetical protein